MAGKCEGGPPEEGGWSGKRKECSSDGRKDKLDKIRQMEKNE